MKSKTKLERSAHSSAYWPLFKHMSENHGLTLLDSEMEDICRAAEQIKKTVRLYF